MKKVKMICHQGSQLFRNPHQLYNIKIRTLSSTEDLALTIVPMDQQLIKQIQEPNRKYMQSLTYSSDCYCHINFNENSISDIEHFSINGSSIFRFDTTFEIDGFWLTDTSYTNLSVIDESGNHPEFPGPNMVHFQKEFMDYRPQATEMTFANENLAWESIVPVFFLGFLRED